MKIQKLPCNIKKFSEESYDGLVKAKVIIMHESKNRNGSSFSIDAMNDAMESLKRRPLLAYIKRDEDGIAEDFDEHNYIQKIVQGDDGYEIQTYYLERPIGCFFDDCNPRYEEIDGVTHLVADCYIWEDYSNESLQLLEDSDGQKDVSMEIEVIDSQYNKKKKVLDINKFKFRAVTVLGSNIIQGMNGTCNLNLYTNKTNYDDFIMQVECKLNNLKKEGEDMSVNQEPTVDPVEPTVPNTYGLSVTNLREQAYTQIAAMTVTKTDYWGDEYEARMFYYRDLLPNENIVVVESALDYSYFGVPYTVNEDTITLDFDSKKEYISEWREKKGTEDTQLQFDLDRDQLKDIVLSKFNAKEEEISKLKGEFTQKETEITNLQSELEGLKAFKQSVLDTEYKAEIEQIANEFTLDTEDSMIQLSDEEISEFKEKAINKQITKEEFKGELYKLQGMKFMANKEALLNSKHEKFSAKDTGIDLKINKETKSTVKPYGGILG